MIDPVFDTNHDSSLSPDEVKALLKRLGIPPTNAQVKVSLGIPPTNSQVKVSLGIPPTHSQVKVSLGIPPTNHM